MRTVTSPEYEAAKLPLIVVLPVHPIIAETSDAAGGVPCALRNSAISSLTGRSGSWYSACFPPSEAGSTSASMYFSNTSEEFPEAKLELGEGDWVDHASKHFPSTCKHRRCITDNGRAKPLWVLVSHDGHELAGALHSERFHHFCRK